MAGSEWLDVCAESMLVYEGVFKTSERPIVDAVVRWDGWGDGFERELVFESRLACTAGSGHRTCASRRSELLCYRAQEGQCGP